MAQRYGEIGSTESEKLLSNIKVIAVFGGKASRSGNAFDISQQQDTCGERKQFVKLQEPKGRHGKTRQPTRDVAGDGDASRRKTQQRRDGDRRRYDGEAHRLTWQKPLAKQEQQDRHKPDRQHDPVDTAKLACELDQALEEIVPATGDPEQAWQLRHDDG